jgi:hypothetical protein
MKKTLLAFTLFISIIVISGCGDSEKKGVVPPQSEYVFDSEAEYTMSDYLFPSEDQVNVYTVKIYKDSTGSRHYTDYNESYLSEKYTQQDNIISIVVAGIEKKKYTVNDINITLYDADKNRTIAIVKFVDMHNFIIKEETLTHTGSGESRDDFSCKLSKDLGEKTVAVGTQADFIEVICSINSTTNGTVAGGKVYETEKEGSLVFQYAKGIGVHTSTRDTCESTTFNGVTEKSCEKVVTDLVDVVSL